MATDKAKIALDLLDSAQGHPVQTWKFDGEVILRIGRADDVQVTIVDPRVSRLHAELELRPLGWILLSRGRNGVLVDGAPVMEHLLHDKQTFQLGPSGPVLRFRENLQPIVNTTTIDGSDNSLFERLQIDLGKKNEEVKEITSGLLFKQLKERADAMRRKNQANRGEEGLGETKLS